MSNDCMIWNNRIELYSDAEFIELNFDPTF